MKNSILIFLVGICILFSLSGCNNSPKSLNGIQDGLILEKVPNSDKVKLVRFLPKDGKIVFLDPVSIEWPSFQTLYTCPDNPPNPDGIHHGCKCSGSGIDKVASCLSLAMSCKGYIAGNGQCYEVFVGGDGKIDKIKK